MALTPEQVRWVAHLARLELDDATLEKMARQLSDILAYVDQLKKVNTEGVEPLAHPLPAHNVFREDDPIPSLPANDILSNASDRHGDFYAVPAVLE
jgi:aspartyl-tRNA(Asn)/glutamyl-tRNA(Gln) amidotransferase subunit C